MNGLDKSGVQWQICAPPPIINPAHSRPGHRCCLVCSLFAVLKGPVVRALVNTSGPPQTRAFVWTPAWYKRRSRIISRAASCCVSFTSIRIRKTPVIFLSFLFFLHSVCQASWLAAGSEFKSLVSRQVRTSPQSRLAAGYTLRWILMEVLLTGQRSRSVCSAFDVYEWKGVLMWYAFSIRGVCSDVHWAPRHMEALSSYSVWLLVTKSCWEFFDFHNFFLNLFDWCSL